jgi:hypothetical protein
MLRWILAPPPRGRRRMTRLRISLLALLVAAAALVAACGSGGASDDSVDGILKQTFESGKSISSARVALDLNADLKGVKELDGPVALKLNGPFESDGAGKLPKFDLSLSISASGSSFSAGATSTGKQGFVKFGGTTYSVPTDIFALFKQGYEQTQTAASKKKSGITFNSLGIHPRAWLKDAHKAGTEDVGGAETTHITASIDMGKFVDDLNQIVSKADSLGLSSSGVKPLTGLEKLEFVRSVKSSSVDVYSGNSDRILRGLKVEVAIDVPAEARSSVGGLSTGTVNFDLTLSGVNEKQSISAPSGQTRPLSELLSRFGLKGLTAGEGGSGSGSGSGGGSPTTTSPSTSTASKKYLDCLQKAGQDLAKVQKCADLLSG